MTEPLSAAERVEIERACERIVYAYARALDLGDMGAAADWFAENGSMARPKTLLTKHLATNVMIDVESRHEARGISNLTMISTTPPDDRNGTSPLARTRLFRRVQGSLRTRERRMEAAAAARLDPDEVPGCRAAVAPLSRACVSR